MRLGFACLFLQLMTAPLLRAETPQPSLQRFVAVTGNASVSVVPDQVEVSIGIEKVSKIVKDAKRQSDESMANILAVAKSFRIPDSDIRSDYARIDSENHDPEGKPQGLRYVARRSVRILLKDIKIFDQLTAKLFDVGANVLSDVRFSTSTQKALEAKARKLAVLDAKEKAEQMTGELGLKLGPALQIVEVYGSGAEVMESMAYADMASGPAMRKGASEPSGPTLALGQIEIKSQIQIKFDTRY